MLDEEKIVLMTKLASYEKREGKENLSVWSFFRGDYVGYQLLKSAIYSTVAYVIAFAMYIFYDFEKYLREIYQMDLLEFARKALTWYIVTVVVYSLITLVLYYLRFSDARNGLKNYYAGLKRLYEMSEPDE